MSLTLAHLRSKIILCTSKIRATTPMAAENSDSIILICFEWKVTKVKLSNCFDWLQVMRCKMGSFSPLFSVSMCACVWGRWDIERWQSHITYNINIPPTNLDLLYMSQNTWQNFSLFIFSVFSGRFDLSCLLELVPFHRVHRIMKCATHTHTPKDTKVVEHDILRLFFHLILVGSCTKIIKFKPS